MKDAPPDTVRSELRGLLDRSLALEAATRDQACQWLAEVHQSTTPAQRVRAAETLGRYAADLRRAMLP